MSLFDKEKKKENIKICGAGEEIAFNEDKRPKRNEEYRDAVGNESFILPLEDFGPFKEYITDDSITDVDWNGTDLWVTNTDNVKTKVTEERIKGQITEFFINSFSRKIANVSGVEFNRQNSVVEVETKELRISMFHSYIAQSGISICIRKTPPINRINEKYAIESNYASKEVLSLLANCIKAHMNIVIAGQPRAGKTEFAKYLSTHIPDEERVITIEDVLEWRYKEFRPEADCVEIKVNSKTGFDYSKGIIASLKQNCKWLMIAECRGKEITDLVTSLTTGVNGITTIHTHSVDKIPQRMVNMSSDSMTENRLLNNIYEFVDVGVMISFRKDKFTGKDYRIIDEVGFFLFDNETGKKECVISVKNGEILPKEIPFSVKEKFAFAQIDNPYFNELIESRLLEQEKGEVDLAANKDSCYYKEIKKEKISITGLITEDDSSEAFNERGGALGYGI